MPIEVLTGLPRNGKTLRMMWLLEQAAKDAKRPLFAAGIDGLQPGLATVLDDPRRWNERRPDGSYIVPDGSLIFVDEAWKWFGHLHNASRQATPVHVLDMAEHGHRGLDFVFTTQGPGQLYPFLRTLIQGHTHCVRVMGAEAAKLYFWPELNDDVKSPSMREAAITTFWRYPRALYAKYHSANVHTVKFKLNPRIALLGVLILAVVVLGYFGISRFRQEAPGLAAAAASDGGSGAAEVPATGGIPLRVPTPAERIAYTEEYAYRHTPRIAGMPWTAPIFDGRPVTAEPRLLCIARGQDGRDGCNCYTEQFTPVVGIDLGECMTMAKQGEPYNPYRALPQQQGGATVAAVGGEGVSPSVTPSSALPGVRSPDQVAAYGGFRQ